MLKTKMLYATYENYGKPNRKYIEIDQVINDFIKENNITEDKLVDIKFAPVGNFQADGEGQIESAALIIYK